MTLFSGVNLQYRTRTNRTLSYHTWSASVRICAYHNDPPNYISHVELIYGPSFKPKLVIGRFCLEPWVSCPKEIILQKFRFYDSFVRDGESERVKFYINNASQAKCVLKTFINMLMFPNIQMQTLESIDPIPNSLRKWTSICS